MNILGINYAFHDTSACLLQNGELSAALEQERFSRVKHTYEFPTAAIDRCLALSGLRPGDLQHVAVSVNPTTHWFRKLVYGVKLGLGARAFFKNEFWRLYNRQRSFWQWFNATWPTGARPQVHFIDHHQSHILGSFYVSPFDEAALLSIDGSGEWSTHWMGEYRDGQVHTLCESFFPHSLGSFYEAGTEFCGFRPNYDEGKTMGLAPFGDPDPFYPQVASLVSVTDSGEIQINPDYFDFPSYGARRFNDRFISLFGQPRRLSKDAPIEPHHENVAAAFQRVLEDRVLDMCRILERQTRADNIVIAGGVALNSVMNGRIIRDTRFHDAYIMPAAGDNGTAIGAAYCVWNGVLGNRKRQAHLNPYLGTEYGNDAIEKVLKTAKLTYRKCDDICQAAAELLHQGRIIGWFQGRMEIGPRALGSRSILADPTNGDMKRKINAEVKYREPYRPFAPSATAESFRQYFELTVDDPFMLKVDFVRPEWRNRLAAITHVDGSARLQTVHADTHPRYHRLITEFGKLSGAEVVLNTSFNVMGEPVVESPEQAIRCFYTCGLDALAIGDFLLIK